MNLHRIMILALALLVCACDGSSWREAESTKAAISQQPSTQAQPTNAEQSCPSQDFTVFLQTFMGDVEAQRAHTANPLQSESIDISAVPEPKPMTRLVELADLKFPLIPAPQQQASDGLVLSQIALDEKEAEVMLVKPDTDYQMSFFFRKDNCWELYRMRDDSL